MGHLTTCIVCNGDDLVRLAEIRNVPVHCNVLKATTREALRVPRADMDLSFCRTCGHFFNSAFDSTLMGYQGHYENALHFSLHFREYANSVAEHLVSRYDLVAKEVLEVGCGSGEFLELICEKGGNSAVGFDPSKACLEHPNRSPRVKIIPDFYSEEYQNVKTDLVVCRHVLEHIEAPLDFIRGLRNAARSNSTVFYIEVPNGRYTVATDLVWDLIYEHCSYFSQQSLCRLFASAGYGIIDSNETYGGQFLYVEASPRNETKLAGKSPKSKAGDLARLADRFGDVYRATIAKWNAKIARWREDGKTVVLWGGGSKGVMFLNSVGACASFIDHVVDINPRKHGKYVAGTGQHIVGPTELREIGPDIVLIMNPLYRDEIAGQLADLDISASITAVSTSPQ